MNAYDLFRAVGEVGGDLVEEAAAETKKRRRAPIYAAALAACAALMLLLARPWAQETPAVATAPVAMDMVAFVIYGGRMYECSQVLEGDAAEELMGEYLFTSPGYIDEWSSPEEYTDGTGSVAGDVYTVKGYDSAFRLCIPLDGGALLELYDTLDGITLRTGEDLYGERLHLRDNWREAEYQTHDDWNIPHAGAHGGGDSGLHRRALRRGVRILGPGQRDRGHLHARPRAEAPLFPPGGRQQRGAAAL